MAEPMTPADAAELLREMRDLRYDGDISGNWYVHAEDARASLGAGADALEQLQAARNSEAEARSVIALHQQNGCDTQFYVEGLRMELQATRDRHAALEVGAAELHDFILSVEWYGTRCHPDITGCQDEDVCPVCDASAIEGHRANCRLARILRTPPPAAGQTILDEVERLRVFHRAVHVKVKAYRQALAARKHGGVAQAQLAGAMVDLIDAFGDLALATLDQAAPQEPTDG